MIKVMELLNTGLRFYVSIVMYIYSRGLNIAAVGNVKKFS